MKQSRPEVFFAVVIFIIGTLLLLIVPAGANFDEETYVARIWEMSMGHIMPNSYLPEAEHYPQGFLTLSYRRQVNYPVIDLETFKQQLQVKIDWDDFVKTDTRAVYFPTLFIIQAGIMRFFGPHLHVPILVLYFLLRFSYLLIYCLLVYLSIKVLPFGKWLFGTLAVAPMCLIQAASVSSDPAIFGISFLFIAWTLHLACDPAERMSSKDLLVTCLLILALGTLKPNTIFLLVLLPLIPMKKWKAGKTWIAVLISMILSLAMSLGWSAVASQYFLGRESTGAGPIDRFLSLFTSPQVFLKNLAIAVSTQYANLYRQAVGVSGYSNWLLPPLVYWAYPLVVLLAFFSEREKIALKRWQRVFLFLAGLVNVLMVFIIFYVVETPEGYSGIWGLQGRYFIPFFPLLLLALQFKSPVRLNHAIVAVPLVLIAAVTAGALFLDYHVVCGPAWISNQDCSLPRYKNWDPSTFLGVNLDRDTRIRQSMVVQCEELSQIELYVNQNAAPAGQKEFFILEDMDWKPIRTTWIRSDGLPGSGWMTINLDPPVRMQGEEIQFELIPKDGTGIPLLELGYFPTNEYSKGILWFNDEGTNSDLVMHYRCLDDLASTLK